MTVPDRTINVTKLVLVESLRPSDVEVAGHTGQKLAQDVANSLGRDGIAIPIQVLLCPGAEGFRRAIADLTSEAATGEHLPMLHIECHGDPGTGLEFGDGSLLSWEDLAGILSPLNSATELGLMVSVAACFGGHAIAGIDPVKPAPFFALIGPTHGLWSNELYDGLRDFYVNLQSRRMTTAQATQALLSKPLETGHFVVLTVRQWFRAVCEGYLDHMASPEAREVQAMRHAEKARAEGFNSDLDYWRRRYLEALPGLLTKYHRAFFMIDRFPAHAQYFQQALDDILAGLQERGLSPEAGV